MAANKSTGPVTASAFLTLLPRTLDGGREKEPEYRITEHSGRYGGRNPYEPPAQLPRIFMESTPGGYAGQQLSSSSGPRSLSCGSCSQYKMAA